MFALSLLLVIGSCRDEDFDVPLDNHQQASELIDVFDRTRQDFFAAPNKGDAKIGDSFIRASREQGLNMVKVERMHVPVSENALPYLEAIKNTRNGLSHEDYTRKLSDLEKDAISSDLSEGEKQYLAENIRFMVAFVEWMGTLEGKYSAQNDNPTIDPLV